MPMLWDGLKLFALVAIVYGLMAVFVLQEDYLNAQFEAERTEQHALLGNAVADYAELRARNLFTRIAVNNGAMQQSLQGLQQAATPVAPPAGGGGGLVPVAAPTADGVAPGAPDTASTPGASPTASPATNTADSASSKASNWSIQRMRVLWTILFITLVRASYALIWWPFLVLTLVPALVDAIATRKVDSTTFALTSPQLQGFVMRALPLMFAGYFLWIVLPFHEHPLTVPIGIALTSAMIWLGITEFAKRG